jgi:hypothetical protein
MDQFLLRMINNSYDSVENPFNRELTTGYLFGVIVWMGMTGLQSCGRRV